MQLRLDAHAEQRLALAPAMLHSLEVLQLAADDLCALIEREVAGNETLLVKRRGAAHGGVPLDAPQDVVAPPLDLPTWLGIQLAWRGCPEPLAAQVLELAALCDERGLLPQTDEELAAALGPDWHEALAVLQTLEPRGLGAQTAVQAMLLQLDGDDPDRDDLAALLSEHLDALARRRTAQVARALGLEAEDVERLVGKLRTLTTRPAAGMARSPRIAVRVELSARLVDGEVVVRARGGDVPELAVDARYAELARSGDPALRRYLLPKLGAARALIRAVGQRRRTMVKVAAAIMRRQVPFLEHGDARLCALRMADVADDLGCHTSTVSRAIAGKWIDTVHGVRALRGFFAGSPGSGSGAGAGPVLGARAVRRRVAELIAAEDPARPLADDELVALLASEGITVARRTVAKYRAELGLPAHWHRQRAGARGGKR